MKGFNSAVAFAQLFLLALWEAVGGFYFNLPPVGILLVWLVGIVTLNVGTATVLRTFIKLTQAPVDEEVSLAAVPDITEEDIGG